jgi:hypothetical protein
MYCDGIHEYLDSFVVKTAIIWNNSVSYSIFAALSLTENVKLATLFELVTSLNFLWYINKYFMRWICTVCISIYYFASCR